MGRWSRSPGPASLISDHRVWEVHRLTGNDAQCDRERRRPDIPSRPGRQLRPGGIVFEALAPGCATLRRVSLRPPSILFSEGVVPIEGRASEHLDLTLNWSIMVHR